MCFHTVVHTQRENDQSVCGIGGAELPVTLKKVMQTNILKAEEAGLEKTCTFPPFAKAKNYIFCPGVVEQHHPSAPITSSCSYFRFASKNKQKHLEGKKG